MDDLIKLLKDIGISKVKLAKFLGVSRQMIYNYLELDSIDKWPNDKKVLLFNLLVVFVRNQYQIIHFAAH